MNGDTGQGQGSEAGAPPSEDEWEPQPYDAARPSPASVTLLRASDAGTVIFTLVAVATTLAGRDPEPIIVATSATAFLAGALLMVWGFLVGVQRSRADAIDLGGLFFLAGTAPRSVRRRLRAALAVQILVGMATAAARPLTDQAFGVLAPMFGLGIMTLWAARFGRFGLRRDG